MRDAIRHLQAELQDQADPAVRDWWEAYLKGEVGFRGVQVGQIRTVVHAWHVAEGTGWHPRRLRELAVELIEQDLTEDKLAGMLLLQEILIPAEAIPWRSDSTTPISTTGTRATGSVSGFWDHSPGSMESRAPAVSPSGVAPGICGAGELQEWPS